MSPGVIKVLIIGVYLAALVGLGLFSSRLFRGTSKDYLLASHSIGPFLLLMSLFGTTMTGFALVGSTGEAFAEGVGVYAMLASSSGIIHSLCFFVLGIKLWSWGKKYGYTTQIAFFRDRLGSDKIGLLLFPILVGLVVPYLLVGIISAGKAIEGATRGDFLMLTESGSIPPWLTELVICSVVLVYVFFGGMRGTAWANTFQTIVFMVLGVVAFYLIATGLAAKSVESGRAHEIRDGQRVVRTEPPSGLMDSLHIVSQEIPKARRVRAEVTLSDQLATVEAPEKFRTRERMDPWLFLTYMLIPFSVGMFPHLFQHWLTARDANAFKLSVVAHPVFILIVWIPCVLIGVWATTGLIDIPPPIASDPNKVLGFMVKSLSGDVLGGFLLAGILAAIMSSLDSQFLCIGTMFTKDIVVHYSREDRFSDRQIILISRGFIIAVVLATFLLSLTTIAQTRVFQLGIWCFSGFSSLFPLAFLSIYWRGLTKWGAYAGVLTAASVWFWLFSASQFGAIENWSVDFTLAGSTIHTMPVATIFLASTLATVIVSLATPKPDARTLEKFFPAK
ncbi:sodium:solute symporter family protein [Stieleria sp. ICT_E10.1]|uniref:sodium:solute symporter family protein n=1 Tax=Stieleria sedimenti TaxID=2976331 RepID=UPI002180262C|nr:sodium:solute symporter family protein [Stieleria sedimenti]MCS7465964.1 sodium:solute symporter family protein [Stieleria sedimenti]